MKLLIRSAFVAVLILVSFAAYPFIYGVLWLCSPSRKPSVEHLRSA